MPDFDVIVIGAGAAGLAAARRVQAAQLSVLAIEARSRVGGRAWTEHDASGLPLELGCGWLHSADQNEWTGIASELGFTIDRTRPPWGRQSRNIGFPAAAQQEFRAERTRVFDRIDKAADAEPDRPASHFLTPGGRWNALLNSISTYINGVELDQVSVRDFGRYRDTGVNWRVAEGYGALMQAYAAGLDIRLDCAATLIDHSGAALRVVTPLGEIRATAVIVTVPPSVVADEALRFTPQLPEKIEAAHGLPLGLADKLYLRLDGPADLPKDEQLFGATDRPTGSYHLRPFGRPLIEGYFGGALARALEAAGEAAFMAHAIDQLAGLLGGDIRKRLTPIKASAWGLDAFARGSYSQAKLGCAEARGVLAEPVDNRLFFAGEACSRHDFSTAHGAFRTGVAAADAIITMHRQT